MAQPQSNPKIEELRFRIKTDPKSRLFYPLAEELRKVSRYDEAERVLRGGLEHHPTYLSAWVSLGRVLREQHKNDGAVEALKKALQLDPGNVVAARLLADTYVAMGDKVEAIKKYKLVHALLPSDQELEALIERLDRDLNPPFAVAVEEAPAFEEETPFAAPAAPMDETRPQRSEPVPPPPPPPAVVDEHLPTIETPFAAPAAPMDEMRPPWSEPAPPPPPVVEERRPTIETPFAEADASAAEEERIEIETGDAEPMAAAHVESPFEEPAGYTAASLTIEQPAGISIEPAPLVAEVASPWEEEPAPEPEPEAVPEAEAEPVRAADDVTNTLTMADLYARQGLTADARQIYENILQRDPDNAEVRAKLEALGPQQPANAAKVAKLESWLAKVRHV